MQQAMWDYSVGSPSAISSPRFPRSTTARHAKGFLEGHVTPAAGGFALHGVHEGGPAPAEYTSSPAVMSQCHQTVDSSVLLPENAQAAASVDSCQPPAAAMPGSKEQRTLFFGHVPTRIQEPELLQLFSGCGTVTDIVLFRASPKGKHSRGCGLVEFATQADALTALQVLHNAHIWPDCRSPLNLECMVPAKCQREPQMLRSKAKYAGRNGPAAAGDITPDQLASKQARTLFFAAVPPRVIEAELQALFSMCGEVVDVLLFRRYPKCIASKGCGLVEYRTPEQAAFALQSLHDNVMWPDSFKPMLLEPGMSAVDRTQRKAAAAAAGSPGDAAACGLPLAGAMAAAGIQDLGAAMGAPGSLVSVNSAGSGGSVLMQVPTSLSVSGPAGAPSALLNIVTSAGAASGLLADPSAASSMAMLQALPGSPLMVSLNPGTISISSAVGQDGTVGAEQLSADVRQLSVGSGIASSAALRLSAASSATSTPTAAGAASGAVFAFAESGLRQLQPGEFAAAAGPMRPTQTQLAAAAMAAQRMFGRGSAPVQTSFNSMRPIQGVPPPSPPVSAAAASMGLAAAHAHGQQLPLQQQQQQQQQQQGRRRSTPPELQQLLSRAIGMAAPPGPAVAYNYATAGPVALAAGPAGGAGGVSELPWQLMPQGVACLPGTAYAAASSTQLCFAGNGAGSSMAGTAWAVPVTQAIPHSAYAGLQGPHAYVDAVSAATVAQGGVEHTGAPAMWLNMPLTGGFASHPGLPPTTASFALPHLGAGIPAAPMQLQQVTMAAQQLPSAGWAGLYAPGGNVPFGSIY